MENKEIFVKQKRVVTKCEKREREKQKKKESIRNDHLHHSQNPDREQK